MGTAKGKLKSQLWRSLRWLIALAVLAAALFTLAVYWFFYNNSAPAAPVFPLEIAALRAAAGAPGAKPTHIEVETISHTPVPKIAMVAGTSWAEIDLIRVSYRIISPDRVIILDTGHTEENARSFGATQYDNAAWDRVQSAVAVADKVVITHAHADHSGGLGASTGNAFLSPAQIETFAALGEPAPPRYEPIMFDANGLAPFAPGIVLIAAPGHTPGSQMIFVQLESGREFLFMGDTASLADNVRLQRPRARFVTDRIAKSDRGAIFAQTRALRALAEATPELALVPGHDTEAIGALTDRGWLSNGFSNAP